MPDRTLRAVGSGKFGNQTLKRLHLHLGAVVQGLAHHVHALVQAEQGFFVVRHGHCHRDAAKQLRSTAQQVFMAEGDGVKSAGVNGVHVEGHGVHFLKKSEKLRKNKSQNRL